MDAYSTLRDKARVQRDTAIRDAQSLYKQTIKRIELLERSLGNYKKQPVVPEPEQRAILALMREMIPKDRTFTMVEMAEMLRERYPDREFKTLTLKHYFHTLSVRGEIKRVAKLAGRQVTWADKDCDVQPTIDGAAELVYVAALVLEESGPMTMMELTLAIQSRGTRPDAKPRSLMVSLQRALWHNQGRFERAQGGRWGMATS